MENYKELETASNVALPQKVYMSCMKALAGLKMLTDKSPEKRLEPLQEHLTFPALIYLRFPLLLYDFEQIIDWFVKIFISLKQEAHIG